MPRFYPGNVIKTKEGSIEVVYDVKSDGYTSTIFVNSYNSSAGHRDKTYSEEEYCDCGMMGCEHCEKNKPYTVTYYGMEDAELVANTIKDWILKSLTKNFGF
jgi:hypothetical protein